MIYSGMTENNDTSGHNQSRRRVLKALAGIPVLGVLGIQIFRKTAWEKEHNQQQQIIKELGLEDLMDSVRPVVPSNGDLIRIGLIGCGNRGPQLAAALGFIEKDQFEKKLRTGELDAQVKEGNLNVAITGICDVFDRHREKGITIAKHDIFTGGDIARKYPVKAYKNYHDLLADPEIDAVIIATPDHHHATMTIDAIQAGKHVYCEKSLIHREHEVYETYNTLRGSSLVFQQGHQYKQNSVYQQAKEIINRGLLGKITHVETSSNRNSPEGAWIRHLDKNGNPKPGDENSIDWKQWLGNAPDVPFSIRRYYSWARYSEYDTGLYGQLFSHEYDAVNQLLDIGIPATVSATGGQYHYKEFGDIPDVLHTSFEYPEKNLTLTYSANLNSSRFRPRTLYGSDASMTFGASLAVTPDGSSERYATLLKSGAVSTENPMIEIYPGATKASVVDAVSSPSTRYYAARGLTSTNINGRHWDVTHLHLKEWIDCIRNGGTPSSGKEKAFVEGITLAMADISFREGCRTVWDSANRKIIRM